MPQPFLKLKSTCKDFQEAREFRQTQDSAIGKVGNVCGAREGQQMMPWQSPKTEDSMKIMKTNPIVFWWPHGKKIGKYSRATTKQVEKKLVTFSVACCFCGQRLEAGCCFSMWLLRAPFWAFHLLPLLTWMLHMLASAQGEWVGGVITLLTTLRLLATRVYVTCCHSWYLALSLMLNRGLCVGVWGAGVITFLTTLRLLGTRVHITCCCCWHVAHARACSTGWWGGRNNVADDFNIVGQNGSSVSNININMCRAEENMRALKANVDCKVFFWIMCDLGDNNNK